MVLSMVKRYVEQIVICLLAAAICNADAFAQSGSAAGLTPKQFMESFWQLETNGGRLTAQGWRNTEHFFSHPLPFPKKLKIVVIYSDSSVWDEFIPGRPDEVMIGIERIGEVDSELRFRPWRTNAVKEGVTLNLIRVQSPDQWRIDGTGEVLWLNVQTAIRYVERMRTETKDTELKLNAEKTFTALKKARDLDQLRKR